MSSCSNTPKELTSQSTITDRSSCMTGQQSARDTYFSIYRNRRAHALTRVSDESVRALLPGPQRNLRALSNLASFQTPKRRRRFYFFSSFQLPHVSLLKYDSPKCAFAEGKFWNY